MSYKTPLPENPRYGHPDLYPEPRRTELLRFYRILEAEDELYALYDKGGWKPEIGWEAANGMTVSCVMYNCFDGGLAVEWDHPE